MFVKTGNKSVKKQMADRAGERRQRRHNDRASKQRKAIHDGTTIQNGDDDVLRSKTGCKSKKITYPGADNPVTHKAIQGEEAQFNNRKKRAEDGMNPSGRQLVGIILTELRQTSAILPVTHLTLEKNVFDFQKMENQDIKAWEYSKGPLYGYKTYKDYIYALQGGKCLLCGKDINYYHHIEPVKSGRFDRIANIAGLCWDCHYGQEGVHKNAVSMEKLKQLRSDAAKRYSIGLLNSVMPALIEEIAKHCEKNGIQFHLTDGMTTAATRERYGIVKDHCFDAYSISLANRDVPVENVKPANIVYTKRRFKKKSKNIISKRNKRVYMLDGKVVAYNRRKAMDQEDDSLEEFMVKYANAHTEEECKRVIHELDIHPAQRTYTYRKPDEDDNVQMPPFRPGDIVVYEKKNKDGKVTKKVVFPAATVKYRVANKKTGEREWFVCKDQNTAWNAKYCRRVASGCLQVIESEDVNIHITKLINEAEKKAEAKTKKKTKAEKAA